MSELQKLAVKQGIDEYEFDERAGIIEYDGYMPRGYAETKAFNELKEKYKQKQLFNGD
jgi:hypothetical protein